MYSDGQSANFTGHSLDKYRIVFNLNLQSIDINYVNWSEEIRNDEWTWSYVVRLRISRDIAK
ncbi:hypothetical protein T11_302 [Trichinella zimbabwensis]|uniref:Uncharacterized protein n=1 Tax=Trichinella zimbabwensis TaxID=268475 RepID=A0A0V1G9D4_9BILA|nr:hypothetical protein T11_302 [Trichinella zimbabwensis]